LRRSTGSRRNAGGGWRKTARRHGQRDARRATRVDGGRSRARAAPEAV